MSCPEKNPLVTLQGRLLACLLALVFLATTGAWAQKMSPLQNRRYSSSSATSSSKESAKAAPANSTSGPMGNLGDVARIVGENGIVSEDDMAYGIGHTTVLFKGMEISGDRVNLNWTTGDIDAEGNVLLRGAKEDVKASALHYNIREAQGVAWDANGKYSDWYFSTEFNEEEGGPAFRRLGEKEALFRDTHFSGCDFPIPHYYIAAKEADLIIGERIMFRSVTLYIRGVPVLWLPWYTKGLRGGSPWYMTFGFRQDYGALARLGYVFQHRVQVPDWDDPKTYRDRTLGRLDVHADLFSSGSQGVGLTYRYSVDFEKHIGYLELYGIRDTVRDVPDENSPVVNNPNYLDNQQKDSKGSGSSDRWVYRHRHNSMFGRTIFQLNADWMSDPDIYRDIHDRFKDEVRGRLPERRYRLAGTYVREDWLARVMYEVKDRISRDRTQDFSEPYDDDLNYDPDPYFEDSTQNQNNGIPNNRYARVTDRWEGRAATRLVNLFRTPFYYKTEFNVYRALDSSINEYNTRDDRTIQGSDIYGSLTHRLRLGERFTWMNTIGVGMAYAKPDSNPDLITKKQWKQAKDDQDAYNDWADTWDGPKQDRPVVDGHGYKSRDEYYLGSSDTSVSYRQVDPTMLWADYTSRLNARFTETLDGYLKYTYRQVTGDSLGWFYARTGRTEAFEDIHDFPVAYHWIEGLLAYHLLYPDVIWYISGGQNLKGSQDIFANERIRYVGTGVTYNNSTREFTSDFKIGYDEVQERDVTDPNQFIQRNLGATWTTSYIPYHGRYWGKLVVHGNHKFEDDPINAPSQAERRYNEKDEFNITPTIGKQLGPKYAVELTAEYQSKIAGFKRYGVTLIRDLHDATLSLFLGMTRNDFEDRTDDNSNSRQQTGGQQQLEVRAGLTFNQPGKERPMGSNRVSTLRDRTKSRNSSFVN